MENESSRRTLNKFFYVIYAYQDDNTGTRNIDIKSI